MLVLAELEVVGFLLYVYLLKSFLDHKYYIGQTTDVEDRLDRHNSDFVFATKHRRPLKLLGFEVFDSRDRARFSEYQLKKNASERIKFYQKFDNNLKMSP